MTFYNALVKPKWPGAWPGAWRMKLSGTGESGFNPRPGIISFKILKKSHIKGRNLEDFRAILPNSYKSLTKCKTFVRLILYTSPMRVPNEPSKTAGSGVARKNIRGHGRFSVSGNQALHKSEIPTLAGNMAGGWKQPPRVLRVRFPPRVI